MSESRSIRNQIITLFLSGAILQVVNFLVGIFLNRYLSLEERGIYGQVILIYSLFSSLFISGLSGSVLYFNSKYKKYFTNMIVKQINTILLIIGFLFSTFLFFYSTHISIFFKNGILEPYLKVFALYPFFKLISSHYVNILVSQQKTKNAAVFTLFDSLLYFLFVTIALLISPSAKSLIIAMTFQALLISIYVQYKLIPYLFDKTKKANKKSNIILLKKISSYASILGITSSIGFWGWELDKLIVSRIVEPSQYALYVAGATEVPFVNTLINSTSTVLIPIITVLYARGKISEIIVEWKNALKRNAIFVFPIFAFVFLFGDVVITLLYGAKYVESTIYFRAYLLITPIRIASYGVITQAIGKTKINLKASIFFLITNIIFNLVLIKYGPLGSSFATVIATILMAVYYIYQIKKILGINLNSILPFKELVLIMALSLICLLPTLIIMQIKFDLIKLCLGLIIYIITYIILGSKLKIIDVSFILNKFKNTLSKLYLRLRGEHYEKG